MDRTIDELHSVKGRAFDEKSGDLDRQFGARHAAARPRVAELELVHREAVLARRQLTKRAQKRVRVEQVGKVQLLLKQRPIVSQVLPILNGVGSEKVSFIQLEKCDQEVK